MTIDYEGSLHTDSGIVDSRTENRASNFMNYLHTGFQFTGDDFEAGLHEIQIPCTWSNLVENQYMCYVHKEACISAIITLEAGSFMTIVSLITRINRSSGGAPNGPKLVYDEIMHRVISIAGHYDSNDGVHIVLSKKLAQMIGFNRRYLQLVENEIEQGLVVESLNVCGTRDKLYFVSNGVWEGTVTADCPPSMHSILPRLFVECSLVKHRAHTTRHLLRTIPVDRDHRFGDILVRAFDRPLFFPLSSRYFDRISFQITDEKGREVEFAYGTVIATLEIRRKHDAFG